MIGLSNVSKDYGSRTLIRAVDSVSLFVPRGERLAIMGPSGSGKSTLLNLMAGLDTPTTGTIVIDGVLLTDITDDARTKLRRQKIGMIFQTFNLLPTLTAVENVALPLRLQGESKRVAQQRAMMALERVALRERAQHHPDEMSGGENQRVAIARALIFGPSVLLADEPTGNLDSAAGQAILRLLKEIHDNSSVTLVLVTHNEAAAAGCDRVVRLRDGRITADELVQRSDA